MTEKVIKKLKDKCAWFDIYYDEGENTPISFKNNKLYSVKEKQNSGFGLRVNVDNKTGFSFTNDKDKLEITADRAIELSKYGEEESIDLPANPEKLTKITSESSKEFDINNEIINGQKTIDRIKNEYSDANIDINISAGNGVQHLLNSQGFDKKRKYTYYSASVSVSRVDKDGTRVDTWAGKSALGPESYEELANEVLQKLKWSETNKKLDSGKYPIIFTPKGVSSILGILISSFTAKAHYKKITPFLGKIGEKVFSDKLTVVDNPLLENSIYSYEFDDEGTIAQPTTLIDQGQIAGVITDLKYAKLFNVDPTGNSTRGYSTMPGASFSNLIVEPGLKTFDEMVKTIDKGILVEQFIGLGQSNTITGDFSASIDLGFLIEDGKVVGRIKDCMITDNLFSMLAANIELTSDKEFIGSSLVPYLYCDKINFTG